MKSGVINELGFKKGMFTNKHSDAIGNREQVIIAAYNMAENYYHSTAFRHSIISSEDFIMEVAASVAEMYDSGEIDKNISVEGLGTKIKSDIFNKIRREFRVDVPYRRFDREVDSSQNYRHTTDLECFEANETDFGYIKNPEEQYQESLHNQIVYGKGKEYAKELIDEVLKNFSTKPYTGRKYKYVLPTGMRMSPQIIAKMTLEGKSLQDIVELFMPETDVEGNPIGYYLDIEYISHSSPGSYIRNNVHKTRRALEKIVSEMSEEDRLILYTYLQEKLV